MKRIIAAFICFAFLFVLASCGSKTDEPATDTTAPEITENNSFQYETVTGVYAEDNYTLGTLVTVNGETDFVLRGLRLDGNRSAGELNGKDFATEGIRSGFWLDERIEFYLDTDYNNPDSEDVKVICLPHHVFSEYEGMSFDEISEQAAFIETFTAQEPDTACFEPYVFGEEYLQGDYDILFTYKTEIVYYTVINLTQEVF